MSRRQAGPDLHPSEADDQVFPELFASQGARIERIPASESLEHADTNADNLRELVEELRLSLLGNDGTDDTTAHAFNRALALLRGISNAIARARVGLADGRVGLTELLALQAARAEIVELRLALDAAQRARGTAQALAKAYAAAAADCEAHRQAGGLARLWRRLFRRRP